MGQFNLKRGDTLPALRVYLKNPDGTAFNPTGYAVALHIQLEDGTRISRNMTIVDGPAGLIEYAWAAGDWAAGNLVPGWHRMEYEATQAGLVVSFPNDRCDDLVVVVDLG